PRTSRLSSRSAVASATASTARSNTSRLWAAGARKPDTFRTYCRAAARISSSVASSGWAGGRRVLILRHMSPVSPRAPAPHQRPPPAARRPPPAASLLVEVRLQVHPPVVGDDRVALRVLEGDLAEQAEPRLAAHRVRRRVGGLGEGVQVAVAAGGAGGSDHRAGGPRGQAPSLELGQDGPAGLPDRLAPPLPL